MKNDKDNKDNKDNYKNITYISLSSACRLCFKSYGIKIETGKSRMAVIKKRWVK